MSEPDLNTDRRVLLAVYPGGKPAEAALDRLVEHDFPLDRVSLLGRAGASGDDPIGVYYPTAGARLKGWGGLGAFWGGLFGLLGGAAGMFVLPGLGSVVAVGPITEALVGAAAGAGIGGGLMAGGAALTEFTQAVHRMGIPEERFDTLHDLLQRDHYLLLLIVDDTDTAKWRGILARTGADPLWDFPYAGLADAVGRATPG